MMDNLLALLLILLILALVITGGILLWRLLFESVTVNEYQMALKYHRGKLTERLGPGQYIYRKQHARIDLFEMRPQRLEVSGQEILTRDRAQIKLSLTASYQILDPAQLVRDQENYMDSLYTLIQLTLRDLVAEQDLETILAQRKNLQEDLTKALVVAQPLPGLKLLSIQVRDFMLAADLKRAYQELFKARQEAQVSLEKARGEMASLRSLANAARMMEKNPALMRLRLIHAMETTKGNTFVIHQADLSAQESVVPPAEDSNNEA